MAARRRRSACVVTRSGSAQRTRLEVSDSPDRFCQRDAPFQTMELARAGRSSARPSDLLCSSVNLKSRPLRSRFEGLLAYEGGQEPPGSDAREPLARRMKE